MKYSQKLSLTLKCGVSKNKMLQPNKEEKKIVINKEYILTQKQLKSFLDIEGDIINIGLYKGLSPNDIKEGKSMDLQKFFINVTHKKEVKPNSSQH